VGIFLDLLEIVMMSTFFVFVLIALMSLGLISLGEMLVRSLKPKAEKTEPLDYEPVINAVGEGLIGAGADSTHYTDVGFGQIVQHIVHFLGHFLHH
jgi:hypothetical protein